MAKMNRSEQELLYRQSRELILARSGSSEPVTPETIGGCGFGSPEEVALHVLANPNGAPNQEGNNQGALAYIGQQLQRFRAPRQPRFGQVHHKRVPTPLKNKRRRKGEPENESGKQTIVEDTDLDTEDNVGDEHDELVTPKPKGVPDPYYPIYLPIDQAFKAKYVFHHKKGKSFQERVYLFLEHPGGWICFVYHFSV